MNNALRFGLIALICACAHAGTVPAPSTQFVEVEGSHFVLLTDLPRAAALESVRRMENVLAALFQGSWHGDALPREKLRVLQLASARDLHQFASPTMSAFYQPVDLFGEPMLVMSTEGGESENVVLKHELAHALHGTFLPRSPRWFFEGLACYLETLQYDPARDLYLIGAPSDDRLQYLRYHPETDYLGVLTLPTPVAVLLSGQEGYAFQSASWLLVFYLANERGKQLDDYIRRLARREDAQAAFDTAFYGLRGEELAEEVARYLQTLPRHLDSAEAQVRYRFRNVRIPPWNGPLQAREVPAAEVEALRAELFFLSPGLPRAQAHLAESRRALETALRLDPSHPLALAVEMALPENASAPPPLERIRAAAAHRPGDYRAQMLLAFAVGGQRPEERRASLVRAAELAPENAAVLNALAWHDLTHGRAEQALPVAQKAAELAPARAAVLDTYATALAKASRCAEAVRVEERAVELTAEQASDELRRRLIARLDAMRAGCADVPLDEE